MASAFSTQVDVGGTGSATTISGGSNAIPGGSWIHVWVTYEGTGAVTETISCSGAGAGNVWSEVNATIFDSTAGQATAHFVCKNAAAGTYTITCTFGSSVDFRGFCQAVYTGVNTSNTPVGHETNNVAPGSGANAVTSGNLTPPSQPGFIRGVSMDVSGTESSIAASSGYTTRGAMSNVESTIGVKTGTEDKAVTSTSALSATFTAGSGTGRFITTAVYGEDAAAGGTVFDTYYFRMIGGR